MPSPVSFTSSELDPFAQFGHATGTPEVPVLYATNRLALVDQPIPLFTALPWSQLRVGIAHVRVGDAELDWNALHQLSTSDDPESRPVVQLEWLEPKGAIASATTFGAAREARDFLALVERALEASSNRDIVIFVHGANSPMARAAAQAAQFQHFATRRVVVLSFMWPSAGSILRYLTDVANAQASVEPFALLLRSLAAGTSARSIDVLAYSAGSKIVSPALAMLAASTENASALRSQLRLRNVYYAAPDFDTRLFVDQARRYIGAVERITLSVNLDDSALRFARFVHRASRAGRPDPGELDAEQSAFLVDASRQLGFDLVHVDPATIPGLPRRSHAFWYEHPWVSSDVLGLLLFNAGPGERGLEPLTSEAGVRFWTFPGDYDARIRSLFLQRRVAGVP